MTTEFKAGIAQNGTHYVEAAEGALKDGDIVTDEGRFAANKRAKRGAPKHPGGTLIRTYKVTGAGQVFDAQTDLGSPEKIIRQRFYCEMLDEQRIYDET